MAAAAGSTTQARPKAPDAADSAGSGGGVIPFVRGSGLGRYKFFDKSGLTLLTNTQDLGPDPDQGIRLHAVGAGRGERHGAGRRVRRDHRGGRPVLRRDQRQGGAAQRPDHVPGQLGLLGGDDPQVRRLCRVQRPAGAQRLRLLDRRRDRADFHVPVPHPVRDQHPGRARRAAEQRRERAIQVVFDFEYPRQCLWRGADHADAAGPLLPGGVGPAARGPGRRSSARPPRRT